MELFRVGFRTDIKSNDCSLLVFLILEQMAKDQKRRRAMAGEISQEWVDFWRPLVESDATGRDAFIQSLAKAKKQGNEKANASRHWHRQ